MFLKKLHKFIAIILTFLSFSFNLNGQISDNFLLLYESYDKLNNIEQVIEGSENRIYRKYGVSESFVTNTGLKIEPTEHFIGYQIKKFNDLRLIELKFNKDSIEEFFVNNSVPFFSFKGKKQGSILQQMIHFFMALIYLLLITKIFKMNFRMPSFYQN